MFKLRRIRVEGFKALDPLDVQVRSDVLLLIGANGAGKSSALQAISFVRAFAEAECSPFLEARHWKARDLYPKTPRPEPAYLRHNSGIRRRIGSRPVRVSILLENSKIRLFWEFAWSSLSEKTVSEQLWICEDGDRPIRILYYDGTRSGASDEPDLFSLGDLQVGGSITALLKPTYFKPHAHSEVFKEFRSWVEGITSLELLSPIAMRRGVRGSPTDIGPRGERLAGFLASLPSDQRASIVRRLSEFYPLRHLDTTRKRAGWVDMQVYEQFGGIGPIRPPHMSDGFFRLLALSSIPEFGPEVSTILLDEVEDGIEPHVLPSLIRRIAEETEAQLVMTSHSPLLVNFFEPNEVMLLARDEEGRVQAAGPSQLATFKRSVNYFGSGEIWINNDLEKISSQILRASRRKIALENRIRTTEDRAAFFLSSHS